MSSAKQAVPLATLYRPQRFSEVVGQNDAINVVAPLVAQECPPSILLHGPPGTGKTTLARIFAMARHCVSPTPSPCGACHDCRTGLTPFLWHELSGARWDAAENAKEIEELLRIVPWGKYGVFIDEVHGLQPKAADVLLTELEHPRPNRFFVCATTELESVRPALRSRCIIVPLKLVPNADLFSLAQRVCQSEQITYEPSALDMLVSAARGSARELLMALDSVATRGNVTIEILKQALSFGWVDHLTRYINAVLAGDLIQQFDAISAWPAPASEKGRRIKEYLLFLYNFEVSSPRVHNYVNAAFHLIGASDRRAQTDVLNAHARADGVPIQDYWQQILSFWLLDPSLLADEAALAIKLHEFHRLITPSGDPAPSPPKIAAPAPARRDYRSRSRKSLLQPSAPSTRYLSRIDVERLAEAVTFLGQHYGCAINAAVDLVITAPAETLERAAATAVSQLTHELGLRIQDWAGDAGDRRFHWLYRNRRSGTAVHCSLALHIPYDHIDAAEHWLARKQWKLSGAEVSVSAKWWNPQPRSTKVRQTSRIKFQWNRMRELWSDLDPGVLHWDDARARKPLRDLLGLKGQPEAGEQMKIKSVGASRSLSRHARDAAEKNKMKLLSAFKDGAWSYLDTGWELFEHQDRMREIAEREDQIRRVEYIGGAGGPLADKRYAEELEALRSQWADDPRQRPRTWTPWWSIPTATT